MTTTYSPRDGRVLGAVPDTTGGSVAAAVDSATEAAPLTADVAPTTRQAWLEAVATAVEEHTDELVELADSETALGAGRLSGEVSRMAQQLRFYGRVAAEGSYLGVAVDRPTESFPRLVRINRPLGPVAVFGASNFPFGFGVLGNDTASAIAAGCPVVAKAHPAHALTCVRLAELATGAVEDAGAPHGIFSLVTGLQAGVDLVRADGIKAVGFTGSQSGGLALWRIANERTEVIPVFAEMGTVNPVVLTPAGVADLDNVARGYVASFTLGSGQFCTKPGLLFAPAGYHVADAVAAALTAAAPTPTMLTGAIAQNVAAGISELENAGATLVSRVAGSGQGWSADAAVLSVPISEIVPGSRVLEECFGAVALVVEYDDRDHLDDALGVLQGSLAGAVFGAGDDDEDAAHAVAVLSAKVGRVTVGDWPTGVAWTWAQQHGGPWPATSNPTATSVGAAALDRFVRPVTFQSVPDSALPMPVRRAISDDNPWHIPRRVDGVLTTP